VSTLLLRSRRGHPQRLGSTASRQQHSQPSCAKANGSQSQCAQRPRRRYRRKQSRRTRIDHRRCFCSVCMCCGALCAPLLVFLVSSSSGQKESNKQEKQPTQSHTPPIADRNTHSHATGQSSSVALCTCIARAVRHSLQPPLPPAPRSALSFSHQQHVAPIRCLRRTPRRTHGRNRTCSHWRRIVALQW
jgi:hypothetical protein